MKRVKLKHKKDQVIVEGVIIENAIDFRKLDVFLQYTETRIIHICVNSGEPFWRYNHLSRKEMTGHAYSLLAFAMSKGYLTRENPIYYLREARLAKLSTVSNMLKHEDKCFLNDKTGAVQLLNDEDYEILEIDFTNHIDETLIDRLKYFSAALS